MTQTATPTLDDVLGGVLPGRIHLITGLPGSGKTAACLHFLKTGAARRERPVLLTRDRGADLRSIALYVGVDLHGLVRDRRVTVVRYQRRFAARVTETATPGAIMAELRQTLELDDLASLAGPDTPLRIAIDPVSPFIPHTDATGAALETLIDWLEEQACTALLTWTGDLAIGIDRRLEPLIDRVAMILNFERAGRASFRAHIVRARHAIANASPIAFQIIPGLGMSTAPIASVLQQSALQQSVLQQTFATDGAGGEQPAA